MNESRTRAERPCEPLPVRDRRVQALNAIVFPIAQACRVMTAEENQQRIETRTFSKVAG